MTSAGIAPGALSGVRVLDLTTVFMGPFATQMLGDFGAEIVKVEPLEGDVVRGVGPHGERGMGPLFLNVNRNKRSIALDLKSAHGREAVLELAKNADVFVYNVRPAALARLGLAYDDIRAVNAKIVYAGTFGFGRRGRYNADAAYDDVIQAATAIPHASQLSGSDVPRFAPVTYADRSVGLYAMGVICAALFARERTGRGQSIDIPMFETMAHVVLTDHLYGHTFVPAEGDFGYPRVLSPDRRPYATRDGHLCAVVYTDAQWRGFLTAIGKTEMLRGDPRLAGISARTEHIDELYKFLSAEFATRTTAEWRELLRAHDIPAFPALTFESLLGDEHLAETGFFIESDHPSEGRIRMMATPSEWSETPPCVRRHAPQLGEHTREILAEAGYSDQRIDALIATGVAREPA